ncbi:MAG: glycosyltransferase family 2 protein [Bauldia sp.]|nr:glycosyltransferase family 2 protein [Bauldia sp.]
MTSSGAPIAAIVLSVRAAPEFVGAVRSLLEQSEVPEIVVANSGGGDAAAVLTREGLDVPVIESIPLLNPGAARNRGIAATTAPVVAFLAQDCLAAPGWTEARLAAHRAGRTAVGSALLHDRPGNPVATAAHLFLYFRRLPGTPGSEALPYGASYDRTLFERHGLFREDLRTGEDTEFHARLPAADRPAWAPAVRTVHRTPGRVGDLVRDHRDRGRRMVRARRALGGSTPARIALGTLKGLAPRMMKGLRWSGPGERVTVLLSFPFMTIGALAYIFGALTPDRPAD